MDATEWMPCGIPAVTTMAEAKAVAQMQEGGKWKWAKPPGDGVRTVYLMCNAHVGCLRLQKISKDGAGMFNIWAKGTHSEEVNLKRRKNSPLTFDEEAALRTAIDAGVRPGAFVVAKTKEKLSELKSSGEDPLAHKRPEGGLEGKHTRPSNARYA